MGRHIKFIYSISKESKLIPISLAVGASHQNYLNRSLFLTITLHTNAALPHSFRFFIPAHEYVTEVIYLTMPPWGKSEPKGLECYEFKLVGL